MVGAAINSAGWLGLQLTVLDGWGCRTEFWMSGRQPGTVRARAGAHLLIQHVVLQ